jgi:hypothetical protein
MSSDRPDGGGSGVGVGGAGKPSSGTRYEFVLESSDAGARALYRVTVWQAELEVAVTVEITPAGAAIVAGGDTLEPSVATQLVALAKTLARRADDQPWPRRILRWRKPGVR